MENSNALINSVAAGAADITYSNGNLSISVDNGTFPTMYVPNIENFTKITGVAETSQVQNVTFTAANSTTYEFAISQNVNAPNQAPANLIVTYTSDATCTEQEVVDAFIAQINAQTGATGVQVTATDGGASTLTITADAGYPLFTLRAITNTTISAVTTPGVVARGVGADMITAGIAGAVSGQLYTQYIFDFYANAPAQMNAELNNGLNTLNLYVYQSDSDFGAFDGQLQAVVYSSEKLSLTGVRSARCINVGGTAAQLAADGNNSTPVNTEVYIGEVCVPYNVYVTGVSVFNGSDVTDNIKVGLADNTGAVIATSISTAGSGTDAYQRVAFVTPVSLKPGTYYVLTMYAGSTSRYNTFSVGNFGAAVQTGQVFATGFTTITPPTTFTTNVANIASLY